MSANPPDKEYTRKDFASDQEVRWCPGCGDYAILAAVQRTLPSLGSSPENTVFISGIGCSSRFPHYMNTYGFHSLHGRAIPVAEGIKMRRPDLNVFVNTGDGDCCSIGTAHWIHAIRYNMDMTVMMHDNRIYGLTKMQASPTTPKGLKSNTSPRGAYLDPLNPLSTTLGVANVSFVAQAVDWIPDLFYDIISQAFHHKGLSFIAILQRCPNYLPTLFDPWLEDTEKTQILTHEDGLQLNPSLSNIYKNQLEHDPSDLSVARDLVASTDIVPVGILYRNDDVPCYEDVRQPDRIYTPDKIESAFNAELDNFTVETTG